VEIVLPQDDGTVHDLDHLIGSWRGDAEFDAAMQALSQVDEALPGFRRSSRGFPILPTREKFAPEAARRSAP
jgi:hypothetical protein